jgi:hypothetical protein
MHFMVFVLQVLKYAESAAICETDWGIRRVRDRRRMLRQRRTPGAAWQDSAGEIQVK